VADFPSVFFHQHLKIVFINPIISHETVLQNNSEPAKESSHYFKIGNPDVNENSI
jgi:hypothetical protein